MNSVFGKVVKGSVSILSAGLVIALLYIVPSKFQASQPDQEDLNQQISTTASQLATSSPSSVQVPEPAQAQLDQQQSVKDNQVADVEQNILGAPEAEAHVPLPINLTIPSIKVSANVLAMGIDPDGRMSVPSDFVNIGWYKLGARPGQVGSAVMGAHVDNGGSINGVFKNLKKIKIGSVVSVKDSDGNTTNFKVVSKKIYNYKTVNTQTVFVLNDAARLNLITCYGTWLPQQKTYDRRLVVFTEKV